MLDEVEVLLQLIDFAKHASPEEQRLLATDRALLTHFLREIAYPPSMVSTLDEDGAPVTESR